MPELLNGARRLNGDLIVSRSKRRDYTALAINETFRVTYVKFIGKDTMVFVKGHWYPMINLRIEHMSFGPNANFDVAYFGSRKNPEGYMIHRYHGKSGDAARLCACGCGHAARQARNNSRNGEPSDWVKMVMSQLYLGKKPFIVCYNSKRFNREDVIKELKDELDYQKIAYRAVPNGIKVGFCVVGFMNTQQGPSVAQGTSCGAFTFAGAISPEDIIVMSRIRVEK